MLYMYTYMYMYIARSKCFTKSFMLWDQTTVHFFSDENMYNRTSYM